MLRHIICVSHVDGAWLRCDFIKETTIDSHQRPNRVRFDRKRSKKKKQTKKVCICFNVNRRHASSIPYRRRRRRGRKMKGKSVVYAIHLVFEFEESHNLSKWPNFRARRFNSHDKCLPLKTAPLSSHMAIIARLCVSCSLIKWQRNRLWDPWNEQKMKLKRTARLVLLHVNVHTGHYSNVK